MSISSALPAARLPEWRASVDGTALRSLDEQLLVDLLVLEQEDGTRGGAAHIVADYLRSSDAATIERFRETCIERGVAPSTSSNSAPDDDSAQPLLDVARRPVAANRFRPRESAAPDASALSQLYSRAVAAAEATWDAAATEGSPALTSAVEVVEELAHAVTENHTAAIALTASDDFDNYTFTHMVNVAILTMGQARTLGMEGQLLRDLGLAALMHDIGKVLTPAEILHKPERLTDAEFQIMQRHTIDGAEILRRTPAMPLLAPVVAFEHHLRVDGSGYPAGARRQRLNVATMMCSIADVYDAMRSQRAYQQAYPSERIFAVLQRRENPQFDPELVRHFVDLLGCHPCGTLATS